MSASAYSDEDIKKRLELTLFTGFDENADLDTKDSIPEKLLYFCLVNEEKAKSSKKNDDSDDDDELKFAKKDQRCICLSISKKMKIRIHSLKQVQLIKLLSYFRSSPQRRSCLLSRRAGDSMKSKASNHAMFGSIQFSYERGTTLSLCNSVKV